MNDLRFTDVDTGTRMSLRHCFSCGILLLIASTWSDALYIPSTTRNCGWKLYATPEFDKNVLKAKHAILTVAAAILCVPSEVFKTPPMLEPPVHSIEEYEHRDAVSDLLAKGWNTSKGFHRAVSDEDDDHSNTPICGPDPSTYGEITELGARQLFNYMEMTREKQEGIVFFDLGSGVGKLVTQSYLELPRLRRAVGVELEASRHDSAIRAWSATDEQARILRDSLVNQAAVFCTDATVQFIQGDLFHVDVSDATHVYVASLCFSSEMMERLADKLLNEASCLEVVATLKQFPKRFEGGKPAKEYVEMSWTRSRGVGCAVYFYTAQTS
jgi:hypothetical protein